MPSRAKRPCNHPGCNVLVDKGYCDKHRKDQQSYDQHRGSSAERGYNSRWQKARRTFLMHHPLCAQCEAENRVEPATVVDHIIPHKGNQQLFWDRDNWQALCKRCHDRKTAAEDGGFNNPTNKV